MGRAHSNAYLQVNHFFPREHKPVLKACCGREEDTDKLEKFAETWGYESIETDWRKLIARDDIDLIDVCVPNDMHHDVVIAAAEAGKMIVCEKPLAMNVAEAEEMVAAVEKAGVANMVSFNYRRVPAISLAKQIIDEGRIGRPFHYRATYNQDYTISADVPQGGMALWRLDAKRGRLRRDRRSAGPLDRHGRMAQRPDPRVVGPHRDVRQGAQARRDGQGGAGRRSTTPACSWPCSPTARWARSRAPATPAAARTTTRSRLNGENGAVFFDLEDPHILQYFRYADPADRQEDRRPPDRLAADPRDQLRASLHEELVGARLHDRLRAHVHQRLRRLPGEPGRRPGVPARHPRRPCGPSGSATRCWQSAKQGKWVEIPA